jgi:hypothetical protein
MRHFGPDLRIEEIAARQHPARVMDPQKRKCDELPSQDAPGPELQHLHAPERRTSPRKGRRHYTAAQIVAMIAALSPLASALVGLVRDCLGRTAVADAAHERQEKPSAVDRTARGSRTTDKIARECAVTSSTSPRESALSLLP